MDGLTKERILDMQPGPKSDAVLLEKLFGWKWIQGPKFDYDGPCESHKVLIPPNITEDEAYKMFPPKESIPPTYFVRGLDLSTTWEGMRMVIKGMQRRGWLVELQIIDQDLYRVCFWNNKTSKRSESVRDQSAPYAVALAAIKALETESSDVERDDGLIGEGGKP